MNPLVHVSHDVNDCYEDLMTSQKHFTRLEDTRNGPARVYQAPAIITHENPHRRVLFDPVRDANPFFHFMEAIWMMAGSNEVEFPAKFAKNLANYSDDGKTLNGAYGHRWRTHFDIDQIGWVINALNSDLSTRRAVIAMWDPVTDCEVRSLDLPCNTHMYFRVADESLDMTVCNRSNDMVWGALGANVVHMSYLQEYIASAIGMRAGRYYQFTNNLHIYEGWEDKFIVPGDRWYSRNPTYSRIVWGPHTLDLEEAARFVRLGRAGEYECSVLRRTAVPMYKAWVAYKNGDFEAALRATEDIHDADWQRACAEWLKRRKAGRVETQES